MYTHIHTNCVVANLKDEVYKVDHMICMCIHTYLHIFTYIYTPTHAIQVVADLEDKADKADHTAKSTDLERGSAAGV